jgi:methylmalonyl-CoA mutase cobalamin-binding domain/chain
MAEEGIRQELIKHLADLDEAYVLDVVPHMLAEGHDSLVIMQDCEYAMRLVGERYERREYYLSALIMAGEIFREVMMITQPSMEQRLAGNASGRVLLGTVHGDIHDIGKDIVALALRCYGFTVDDLGVDVAPERFLDRVLTNPFDIIGLSGLVTVAYESMKETVQLIHSHTPSGQPAIPIIVGGGTLSEDICRFVGADFWVTDALEGVRICQQIMQKTDTV